MKLIDLTGQQFGHWTVVSQADTTKFGAYWNCTCDCSPTVIHQIRSCHLRSGRSKSCGCHRNVELSKRLTTHGRSKTRIYKIWEMMVQRCTNPRATGYRIYGGRGITIDPLWLNFDKFYADMGEPPSDNHTLDRKETNLGYSKVNCRWATYEIQANNRRTNVLIEFNGRSQTLTQWANELGITRSSLQNRLAAGWSLERALTEGKRGKKHE